jgi:hypothetical protein
LQLARASAAVDRLFIQAGGGALASACIAGLEEAQTAGVIGKLPRIHAVQTEAVAPLRRAWEVVEQRGLEYAIANRKEAMWPWETPGRSIATGILDDETYDWAAIVRGMLHSGGFPIVVSEEQLRQANGRRLRQRHRRGRTGRTPSAERFRRVTARSLHRRRLISATTSSAISFTLFVPSTTTCAAPLAAAEPRASSSRPREVLLQVEMQAVDQLGDIAPFFDAAHEAARQEDVGWNVDVNGEIDEAGHFAAQFAERLLDENDGSRIFAKLSQLRGHDGRFPLVDIRAALDPLLQIGWIRRRSNVVIEVDGGGVAEDVDGAADDARLACAGDPAHCDDVGHAIHLTSAHGPASR